MKKWKKWKRRQRNRLALALVKVGLKIMNLRPMTEWDDEDYIVYRRLVKNQSELQSKLGEVNRE